MKRFIMFLNIIFLIVSSAYAQIGFKQGATGRGAGNFSRFTKPLYFSVSDNERLVLQCTNISGSNAATFKYAQFLVHYLHE